MISRMTAIEPEAVTANRKTSPISMAESVDYNSILAIGFVTQRLTSSSILLVASVTKRMLIDERGINELLCRHRKTLAGFVSE